MCRDWFSISVQFKRHPSSLIDFARVQTFLLLLKIEMISVEFTSSATVKCVYQVSLSIVSLSIVSVECVCRLCLSSVSVECICRVHLLSASVMCIWGMRLFSVSAECICCMHLSRASV